MQTPSKTLDWCGQTWSVRGAGRGGPGPNDWDPDLVSVDRRGRLHLRIRKRGDTWACSELNTVRPLGHGAYVFELESPTGRFDPRIVLGLFNYPTRDVGPDATNEIDIEFARWGNPKSPPGNYTVWPAVPGIKPTSDLFEIRAGSGPSVHRFVWSPSTVEYASAEGRDIRALDDPGKTFARWTFAPPDPEKRIPRAPLRLHLNLWLFQGKPPADGRDIEVVVRRFAFTPTRE